MSRKLLPLSVSAALLGGTALADAPRVAVDIAPVHSLVAMVMEGVGEPDLVIQSGASPHEYNLRPSEAEALQESDLVFWIGPDLTPWMEDAVETLAADAAVTTLLDADGIELLDFRENALFEAHEHGDDDDHGHDDHDDHDHDEHASEKDHDDHDHDDHDEAKAEDHDHDHDDHDEAKADDHDHDHDHDEAKAEDHDHDEHEDHDDHAHDDHDDHEEHAEHDDHDHDEHHHGEHDPHAWLSPENASVWLNVIAAKLSEADPDNAGAYFANAATARANMETLSEEVNEILDPARGGSFIVFHDAYQYFETDFDFPASGAISIGDAADPSPARIAEIQERVQNEGIDCVLAEPQFNPGLVETVLEGTEASTGVMDPLGSSLEPGAELYPQLIRNMAETLAECLSANS